MRDDATTRTGVSYRRKEEIDNVRANYDCIELAKKRMISKGWLTEAEFKVRFSLHFCAFASAR